MSRYIYIYGLNDDKHDTAIKADSKPIHQRVGTVTNEEAYSPMVTCSHQKGCSHQWGPRIINRDTQGFQKLPYSFCPHCILVNRIVLEVLKIAFGVTLNTL